MAFKGKEQTKKFCAGEEESGDHQKLEDIVDADESIRQEKADKTTSYCRVQAEESAVKGQPDRGPFMT